MGCQPRSGSTACERGETQAYVFISEQEPKQIQPWPLSGDGSNPPAENVLLLFLLKSLDEMFLIKRSFLPSFLSFLSFFFYFNFLYTYIYIKVQINLCHNQKNAENCKSLEGVTPERPRLHKVQFDVLQFMAAQSPAPLL